MLEKIKEFFRNIFGINNKQYIEAPKEDVEPINNIKLQRNINFKDEIAVTNEEEKRILKLQRDFKAGLIEEEDLSEEDFNLLSKLYESQIEKTKQSIQTYKNRIIFVKSKLA
ncbi:MAG: hypothetical protein V8S04_02700 [Clostridia bacterium]|jgi:hypothetical protein